ncbi:MAG: outer membrane beta-barrel protein [Sphingobacterium sp.]
MKKVTKLLVTSVVCFILFSQNSFAQQDNHIYIGYGVASVRSIEDEIENIIITTATGGSLSSTNAKNSGTIFAGYRNYVSEKLEIGGTLIFEHASRDILSDSKYSGSLASNTYAVLAELKYNYINHPRFRLHSGLGAGLAHSRISTEDDVKTEKDQVTDFAYQVDAIGVSYGEKFSVSLNAGFGYRGIVNAVLAYGF